MFCFWKGLSFALYVARSQRLFSFCFYKLAEVVVVRISDEGFSPRNLSLYEGQVSKIGVKLR